MPWILTGHVLAASVRAASVRAGIIFHADGGPAPVTGTLAGIIIWLAVTIRGDLAPPPGR